jgi:hypothetical protein
LEVEVELEFYPLEAEVASCLLVEGESYPLEEELEFCLLAEEEESCPLVVEEGFYPLVEEGFYPLAEVAEESSIYQRVCLEVLNLIN